MKEVKLLKHEEFIKKYNCDSQPDMYESSCCMYCGHKEVIRVYSDFGIPKLCCNKFMFELCDWNSWRLVCGHFEKRE